MKIISALLTTIYVLSISSCATNTKIDEEKIEEEVTSVFKQYIATVNSGEILTIPTYFSDNESFYWVEDGFKVYSNKEVMVASLKSFTENATEVSMETEELIITPISNEVASLFTSYNQKMQFASGFELVLEGAITITLKKEEDEWKFLNGHSSTKKPRGNI